MFLLTFVIFFHLILLVLLFLFHLPDVTFGGHIIRARELVDIIGEFFNHYIVAKPFLNEMLDPTLMEYHKYTCLGAQYNLTHN